MKHRRYSPPQKTTIVLELLKEEDTLFLLYLTVRTNMPMTCVVIGMFAD